MVAFSFIFCTCVLFLCVLPQPQAHLIGIGTVGIVDGPVTPVTLLSKPPVVTNTHILLSHAEYLSIASNHSQTRIVSGIVNPCARVCINGSNGSNGSCSYSYSYPAFHGCNATRVAIALKAMRYITTYEDSTRTMYDCTGFMVAPNKLLTARHCIINATDVWVHDSPADYMRSRSRVHGHGPSDFVFFNSSETDVAGIQLSSDYVAFRGNRSQHFTLNRSRCQCAKNSKVLVMGFGAFAANHSLGMDGHQYDQSEIRQLFQLPPSFAQYTRPEIAVGRTMTMNVSAAQTWMIRETAAVCAGSAANGGGVCPANARIQIQVREEAWYLRHTAIIIGGRGTSGGPVVAIGEETQVCAVQSQVQVSAPNIAASLSPEIVRWATATAT